MSRLQGLEPASASGSRMTSRNRLIGPRTRNCRPRRPGPGARWSRPCHGRCRSGCPSPPGGTAEPLRSPWLTPPREQNWKHSPAAPQRPHGRASGDWPSNSAPSIWPQPLSLQQRCCCAKTFVHELHARWRLHHRDRAAHGMKPPAPWIAGDAGDMHHQRKGTSTFAWTPAPASPPTRCSCRVGRPARRRWRRPAAGTTAPRRLKIRSSRSTWTSIKPSAWATGTIVTEVARSAFVKARGRLRFRPAGQNWRGGRPVERIFSPFRHFLDYAGGYTGLGLRRIFEGAIGVRQGGFGSRAAKPGCTCTAGAAGVRLRRC